MVNGSELGINYIMLDKEQCIEWEQHNDIWLG
jgi:hypothetical protein